MRDAYVTKKLISFLLLVYFITAFSVYPQVIPQRGLIMTAIAITMCFLLHPNISDLFEENNSIIKYLIILFVLDCVTNCICGFNVFNHFIYMIQYICFVVSIYIFIKNSESLYSLLVIMFWPIFVGGPVIGLYQLSTGRYLFGSNDNLDAFFSAIISNVGHANSNYTAICMLFCVMISGALYYKSKRIFYLVSTIISIICVVLTFSRTSTVSLATCLVLFYIFKSFYIKEQKYISKGRILLVVIGIMGLFLLYDNFYSLVERYLQGANLSKLFSIKQSSTADLRTSQWKAAIKVIFNGDPLILLFGYGEGAASAMSSVTGRSMTAHNFIFGKLSENGLLGFFSALGLYINFFIRIWKSKNSLDSGNLWIAMISVVIMLSYLMISINTWELICSLVIVDVITGKLIRLNLEKK